MTGTTALDFPRRATAPAVARVGPTDVALLVGLREAGVPALGILRLVRLRAACRHENPALDGFRPDQRMRFARWLYERERLRD